MTQTMAVLAIPVGWVLDRVSRQRLLHQLDRAGSACTGVVAQRSELLPGASCRVCAERQAAAPESDVRLVSHLALRGAAMLRPGVEFDVSDDLVTVEQGPLLVDDGATVHDPWRPVGAVEDASPLGRPMATRPVALFLGFERDPYLADWVRALANGLASHDVEGRIAVPEPTGGRHLTRPCAPTEESVGALAPEVVVALDDPAVERSAAWIGRRRHGLVRLTPDTAPAVAVGSARIGWWRHRAEARIGRGIDPRSMAELVHRVGPKRDS
jgi:hypothetical protein